MSTQRKPVLLGIVLATAMAPACDPASPPSELAAGMPVIRVAEGPAERGTPDGLGLRKQGDGYVYDDPNRRFRADIAADGSVVFVDEPAVAARAREGGIRFAGVSDWHARGTGSKFAAEKAALLDRTAALRSDMAIDWARDRSAGELERLGAELDAIWNEPHAPVEQRRRTLFERWDECEDGYADLGAPSAEGTAAALESLRAETAALARRQIEAFVRRNGPPGTDRGFSVSELARLNAQRRSDALFDPYGTG